MNMTANGVAKPPAKPDASEAERALRVLFAPGQVVELRAIGKNDREYPETFSGYYDDLSTLADDALSANQRGNVYVTLNPCKPDLLARRCNRSIPIRGRAPSTADGNILCRQWLPIDLDSDRASETSANDLQHDLAIEHAEEIRRYLVQGLGWAEPIYADSGNGAHLLFRIDLPADDDGLVKSVLAKLAERFDNDDVHVDTGVYNPSRIWKLYGTVAKKGDSIPGRPHRLSQLLHVPDDIEVVTVEQLQEFAGEPESEKKSAPKSSTNHSTSGFSVDDFLSKHGVEVVASEPYTNSNGATYRWRLKTRPLCGESDGSAVALEFANGKLGYQCHHNRCVNVTWSVFRKHFEPSYSESKQDNNSGKSQHVDDMKTQREPITYERITSKELANGDYELEYLIQDTMVKGQPMIIAGPQKVLKTSFIIDAAVSVATGGHFLGRLPVTRACRVAVMTGESGLATIQETAIRICAASGKFLCDLDNLIWSPDLPKFGDIFHLEALEKFLVDDAIEVLFIDPAYLCMPSSDAGNLMAQGELLRSVSEPCRKLGVTMVLAHHTKRNTGRDVHDPGELADIAWSGFAEFARQWLLINRREPYEPGTGDHKLWLSVGGSAGHSALWAVDVAEGVRSEFSERTWNVELSKPCEASKDAEQRKEATKAAAKKQRLDDDLKAVLKAVASLEKNQGTKTSIRTASGIPQGRFDVAFALAIREKHLTEIEITKGNNHKYEGYQLSDSEPEIALEQL